MSADYWPIFLKNEEHWLDNFKESLKNVHRDDIKRWEGILTTLITHGLQDVRIGEILEVLENKS